jgi:hypothetical protein
VCDRDFCQFIRITFCVYILIDGSEIFSNIAPGTSAGCRHRIHANNITTAGIAIPVDEISRG